MVGCRKGTLSPSPLPVAVRAPPSIFPPFFVRGVLRVNYIMKTFREDLEDAVSAGVARMRPVREANFLQVMAQMEAESRERRECARLVIQLGRLGLTPKQIAAAIRAR